MQFRPNRIVAVALGAALALTGIASAQTSSIYGTIVGTVSDSSGAVMPTVPVTVTNVNTNISASVTTDNQGFYRAERLVPGTYRVSIEKASFKKFIREAIPVSEGQTVRVNVGLEVGAVTEQIEVTSQVPLIETESPQISSTMSWSERKYLPTRAPDFFSTLGLNPGATTTGYYVSFAGSRSTQYDYAVDGQTFRDPYAGHNASIGNFNEWQQEVKTSYVNNNAEYSQLASVNAATKSGGNQFHGSGAYYYTSGGLKGRDPFTPVRPSGVDHTYATSVGGPIKRDRAFFFVAYSGDRNHSARTLNATVPTQAMRDGNFSGTSYIVKDPYTKTPYTNNTIPANLISPISEKFIDRFYPLPNYGGAAFQQLNYRTQIAQAPAMDDLVGRVDYRFSDKHSVFARYSFDEQNRGGMSQGSVPTVGFRQGYRRDQNVGLSDLYSFSPNLYNELNIGFTRDYNLILPSASWGPEQSGLNVPSFQIPAIPQFGIQDLTTVSQTEYSNYPANIFSLRDNVSLVRGRHRLKVGALWMRSNIAQNRIAGSRVYGVFGFDNTIGTGNGLGNFLLGLPTSQYRINPARYFEAAEYLRNSVQMFVQDDFQLSSKVTINIGLRYEYQQPWKETNGRQNNFDPSTGKMIVPNEAALKLVNPDVLLSYPGGVVTAQQAGYPERLIDFSAMNFAPRIGLAYRPFGNNTVVRAGYGIFYDFNPPTSQATTDLFVSPQYYPTNKIVNGAPLYQFPNPFAISAYAGVGIFSLNMASVKNLRIPYTQQWSLTVEQQIHNTAVRLSYIGTKALHEIYSANMNVPPPSMTSLGQADRPFPQYGPIGWVDQGAGHFYNAMQVQVVHRSRNGFYFDTHWTWAKDVGENQGGNGLDTGIGVQDFYDRRADRGNTSFVPRHRWVSVADYELPFGKGKKYGAHLPGALNLVFGGWRMNGIMTVSSGNYLTPTYCGYDPTGSPGANAWCGRPDRWADGNLPGGQRTKDQWFDASAFTYPGATPANPFTAPSGPIGRYGNSGVNIIKGPGFWQLDYGLVKSIPVQEWLKANFFMMGTNIMNHPNLGDPSMDISSPTTVGRIYGIRGDASTSGIGMRQIRLGLRLEF